MPDAYTTTMRGHLAGWYQSLGFSEAGSMQEANQQQLTNQTDKAMAKALNDQAQPTCPTASRYDESFSANSGTASSAAQSTSDANNVRID